MKNFDRFTEPDNYIDQSGRLIKLKWFALIAAVGIALLFFLSGCNLNKGIKTITGKYYVLEMSKTMPVGICHYYYGLDGSFQDSCNKYQIGDTIK